MPVEIYEILPCPHGRLAIMPRPRGNGWLDDEIASLREMGVTDLVSMLTPAEERELELTGEGKLASAAGIRFHRHPVLDRGLPDPSELEALVDLLETFLWRGAFVAIHCRGGIGRSTVLAAALLVRLGIPAADALASISRARGFEVPDTDEQRRFILSLR